MATDSGVPHIVRVLAVSGGLAAANIHYSQPLLRNIAGNLGVSVDRIGFLPAATQIGFAAGILVALALQAAAPTPGLAFLGALLVGLFGVTPQLMTPFGAVLAPRGARARRWARGPSRCSCGACC